MNATGIGDGNQQETGAPWVTVIFIIIVLSSTLLTYEVKARKVAYVTEGSTALLLGLAAGGLLYTWMVVVTQEAVQHLPRKLIEFNDDVFFQILLPPIIFYAGYSTKKRKFFANMLTITFLGVIGTMVCAGLIAAGAMHLMRWLDLSHSHLITSALALGSIFSSSDTVATLQILDKHSHPVLYSLVFGEGIVNDATAIALLAATTRMSPGGGGGGDGDDPSAQALSLSDGLGLLLDCSRLFALSALLGTAMGMGSAMVVRWTFAKQHATEREVLVVALMGALAYYAAEALELSAILAVFFAGLTSSHYTWHSLSPNAQVISKHGFAIIANSAETVLFVYAGLDMWVTALWPNPLYSTAKSLANIMLLAWGLLACVVAARAAFVFPACMLANCTWRRSDPLSVKEMAVIWWGGLSRGAITLALVYHFFYDSYKTDADFKLIIAASIVIVLLTTVGFGTFTVPLVDTLLPRAKHTSPDVTNTHLNSHDASGGSSTGDGTEGAVDGGKGITSAHGTAAIPNLGRVSRLQFATDPLESLGSLEAPLLCTHHHHHHLASAGQPPASPPYHIQASAGEAGGCEDQVGGAAGVQGLLLTRRSEFDEPRSWMHAWWRLFDARYLQPLLGGRAANARERYNPGAVSGAEGA